MKLTVLVDNNTYIDKYYLGEPAVSYYLEDGETKVLFDTGYSDVFLKNAADMNIDLFQIDYLVFSHGHNDHTGGFAHFLNNKEKKKPYTIVAHPHAFYEKRMDDSMISAPISMEDMKGLGKVIATKPPFYLNRNLLFLGEIPRVMEYESQTPIGVQKGTDGFLDDYVLDDSALVYVGGEGIYIITGCSHSGICNIIEYSKKVTGREKVMGVIGGFHLFDINEQTKKTKNYLKEQNIPNLYPCHCTSLKVKGEFLKELDLEETGVGLTLVWE